MTDLRVRPAPVGATARVNVPRSADATTIVAFIVALQFMLPSRLVVAGLPLSLSAASIVSLGAGTLWMCTQMTTTLGAAKGSNPVRTLLFAYACVLLASYAKASFGYLPPDERALGDHAMVSVFALICLGLVVCDGIRSRERLYFLIRVVVGCASFSAVVGILQYLFGYDLTPHLRLPGMRFSALTDLGTRDGLVRAPGTSANSIEFGVFCAMVLPLAIHNALYATQRGRGARFWWTCVGLIATGLMFSVSRSAIVGLIAGAITLFIGWPARRRVWMIVAGVGFLMVIKLVSPGLLHTFRSLFENANKDSSVQWRTHDYATAHQLISQNAWLGRGTGTWYAPKHEVFDNQYLLTLVDSGALGLAALIGIFLAGAYAAVRVRLLWNQDPRARGASNGDRDLALTLLASIVVIFPTFATFDFMAFATVSTTAFLLAAMSGALLRTVKADVNGEPVDPYAIV